MCIDRRALRPWIATGLLLLATSAQALPQIQSWTTANGARVLFAAAPELPMVDVHIAFDAGSARDGEHPGLASLTAALITQGAGAWNADTIAERLEGVGAELHASADRDMTEVTLRALTRADALDTAVETLAAVLARPTFAPVDVERVRNNRLVALRQEQESPREVASRALWRAVFAGHPYAEDPQGTPDAIAAIDRATLLAFHERHYQGANAVIAIVGALDRAGAEQLAERILGELPRGQRAPALPPVPELAEARQESIAFPSSQTTVLAGQPGMRRGDPDYFPLYVGNHILGGSGLVSLLMEEIRAKRGLSYSTYSYFLPLAQPGPFLMGLQTRNDQAEAAQALMLETLRRFIERGPTEEELDAARKNITGGFPLRIDSNADIVQYLAMIGFYGLELDYLERFTARIESVTAEQIRDAFARRLHPERLVTVSVGDAGARGPEVARQ